MMMLLHWPYENGQVVILSVMAAYSVWSAWSHHTTRREEHEERARYVAELEQRIVSRVVARTEEVARELAVLVQRVNDHHDRPETGGNL